MCIHLPPNADGRICAHHLIAALNHIQSLVASNQSGKWKSLAVFYAHSRDVPKALPEATEKFRATDHQIRAFLEELAGIQKVSAASNQDFVLSLRLEGFMEQLETGEQALVSYARKKRTACAPFYFLSLSEILDTLSREIGPEDSMIRFGSIRATVSHVNIHHEGSTAYATSWVSFTLALISAYLSTAN